MTSEEPARGSRALRATIKVALGLLALVLFVLALQLLKEGAGALGGFVRDVVRVDDAKGALGFGWLAATIVLSGSPIAATALTFFATGVFTDVQTYLAITGSRLGAAFIVLVVGFIYRLRGVARGTSLQMGVLSLLVTYSIYVPAAFLGWWALEAGWLEGVVILPPAAIVDVIDVVFDPVVAAVAARVPAAGVFLAGFLLLLASFHLFDRALPTLRAGQLGGKAERFIFRPSVMFAIGLGVTLFTMSVSVSLGLLVPLGARGIVRRENVIPYVLGANISTFVDTLVASVLLDEPRATTIVLAEMGAVGALSLLVLAVGYRHYERALAGGVDVVLRTNRRLAAFLVVIIIVPFLLIVT